MVGRLIQAISLISVLLAMVAACSGGSPARTPTPANPTTAAGATDTPPEPDATEPSATEALPTDLPTTAGGGTGSVGDVCIVTAAEAGQILGVADVVAGPAYTGSTACTYVAGGDPVALAQVIPNGRSFFELVSDSSGVQTVDGLGFDAVFDPSSSTFVVVKGNNGYTIAAGTGADPEAQRVAWAKQFAAIALTRMP
jgi:hypothetical protein